MHWGMTAIHKSLSSLQVACILENSFVLIWIKYGRPSGRGMIEREAFSNLSFPEPGPRRQNIGSYACFFYHLTFAVATSFRRHLKSIFEVALEPTIPCYYFHTSYPVLWKQLHLLAF